MNRIANDQLAAVVAKFPYNTLELLNAVEFSPDRHSQRQHRTQCGQQVREVGGNKEIEEVVT